MEYQLKDCAHIKCRDANIIGKELERIRKKHGGLRAREVWLESKSEEAPLHDEFEWNNREAADLYRDDQARNVIQCVRIVTSEGHTARAFIQVQLDEGSSYEPLATVMGDAELRLQALEVARSYLAAARRKIHDLEEVATALKSVDSAIRKLDVTISKKKHDAA